MAIELNQAWKILGATPRNKVWAWSAWADDRSALFVTLPQRDFIAGTLDIPLWDSSWDEKVGRNHQLDNIREAQAANEVMGGFVGMQKDGTEHVHDANPYRLFDLTIVEDGPARIVARAAA